MKGDKIEQLISSLRKNRIETIYFSSKKELIDYFYDNLKPNITVGSGDSLTLEQMGIFDLLRKATLTFSINTRKTLQN
jgi:hypothetical protein